MMAYEFKLPDIGEGLHEATIVTWFVKEGDYVKENENVVEVQTDKAIVEISSPVTGTIQSLGAKEGETVPVGNTLISVQLEEQPKHDSISIQSSSPTQKSLKKRVIAAPSVRKLARDLGIDITEVTPTGKAAKVTAEDVQNFFNQVQNEAAAALATEIVREVESPQQQEDKLSVRVDFTRKMNEDRREPIQGIRRVIYENMKKSASTAIHCTGMDEVVLSKLVEVKKQLQSYAETRGVKLTYLPFFVKAVSKALKHHPNFNASVDDAKMEIIYKKEIHIGIATATNEGLIVPVIKHADQKTVLEIAQEIEDLSARARERKLKPAELTGSTFTISNTGANGGWYATPIINYPEVAILGVHSIKKRPIVVNDEIVIGHVMGTSLTFDHRVIDGDPANRFMASVHSYIENPERLILESY